MSSARTRIECTFDPEAVRELKASAVSDISVGGPDLAAQAIKAGLVDEYHLFRTPILVGGGKQSLPTGVRRTSNCSTNAVSEAAWFTFTTAPDREQTATLPGHRQSRILRAFW